MILGVKEGKIVRVRGAEDLPHPLEYFGLVNSTPQQIGITLENLAKDESPTLVIAALYLALGQGLNLSYSWETIKFVLYEVVRHHHPEAPREIILHYSVAQLCEAIQVFVENYYG